ncbi:MAG: hypothetical protein WCD36_01250 [Rhodanobacteraceae bacterium]
MATRLLPSVEVQQPLRLALLLPGSTLPAWAARSVDRLLALEYVHIACIVMAPPAAEGSDGRGLAARYLAWDGRRYRKARSALVACDISASLQGIEQLACSEEAVAALAARDLDVIIDFGAAVDLAAMAACARSGLWWHGVGTTPRRLSRAGLWQPVFAGSPVTHTGLYAISAPDSALQCLAQTVASTQLLSVETNNAQALWKFADMAANALFRLASGRLHSGTLEGTAARALRPASGPGTLDLLGFLPRLAWRRLRASLHRRRDVEHWVIACRADGERLDPAAPHFRGARVLDAPAGHFWADPGMVEHAGRTWLFCEDFDYARDLGSIACMPLDGDGRAGDARIVLSLDSHLSYPQVFEHNGDMLMLPENGQGMALTLYRADPFPWSWTPVATLLEGFNFTDATLWQQDGHWYIFANLSASGGSVHDELYLFHADDLLADWQPHPCNPIVSDVRRARPAGPLFRRHGTLWRPAQDCAINYGRAVVFNEVQELTPDSYRERPAGRLDGSWRAGLHGCHTYAATAALEVIDGKYWARQSAVAAAGEPGS